VAEFDAIKNSIPALLVVVVITTVLTFGSTALVVQGIIGLQDRLERRRLRKGRPQ